MIAGMQKKYGPPMLLDPRFEPYANELRPHPAAASSSS